jgi:cytochrome b involved in lipid metabolism
MGWLRLKRGPSSSATQTAESKSEVKHIEFISPNEENRNFHSIKPPKPDTLPFIAPHEIVTQRLPARQSEPLWIVIDNLGYDCSNFVNEHPGTEGT